MKEELIHASINYIDWSNWPNLKDQDIIEFDKIVGLEFKTEITHTSGKFPSVEFVSDGKLWILKEDFSGLDAVVSEREGSFIPFNIKTIWRRNTDAGPVDRQIDLRNCHVCGVSGDEQYDYYKISNFVVFTDSHQSIPFFDKPPMLS